MDLFPQLQSAAGLIVFPLLAALFSIKSREPNAAGIFNRQNLRIWLVAVGLQVLLALILLKLPWFQGFFSAMNGAVLAIEAATMAGTSFVFGYLGGGDLPFEESRPGAGFILAFRALPLVIVIGALTALLSYWKVLPMII